MSGLDQERARLLDRSWTPTQAGRAAAEPRSDEEADLAGAHGLANALAVSALFWTVAVFLVRHWLL